MDFKLGPLNVQLKFYLISYSKVRIILNYANNPFAKLYEYNTCIT